MAWIELIDDGGNIIAAKQTTLRVKDLTCSECGLYNQLNNFGVCGYCDAKNLPPLPELPRTLRLSPGLILMAIPTAIFLVWAFWG